MPIRIGRAEFITSVLALIFVASRPGFHRGSVSSQRKSLLYLDSWDPSDPTGNVPCISDAVARKTIFLPPRISKRGGLTPVRIDEKRFLQVRVMHTWLQLAKHDRSKLAVAKGKEQSVSAAFMWYGCACAADGPDGAKWYDSSLVDSRVRGRGLKVDAWRIWR